MQTNTNSGENTSKIFVSPTAQIEVDKCSFLGELLNSKDGLIKTKNLLNEVFTTYFVSDNFCGRDELHRTNFSMLFESLQGWVDLCHSEFVANQAEEEAVKTLATLEEMRERLISKKTGRK